MQFLRVLPELRASQVEDYNLAGITGRVLYFSKHYDLDGSDIPPNFRAVSLLRALAEVAQPGRFALELPEPLWARLLFRNLCLLFVWRASGLLYFRRRQARFYAIENNDPFTALFGEHRVPRMLRTVLRWALGLVISWGFEKIAFGSEASRSSYHSLPFVASIPSAVFFELPIARPIGSGTGVVDNAAVPLQHRLTAIFIGQLEVRKGIDELMLAWQHVEKMLPNAKLRIVGTGSKTTEITRWAEASPGSRSCEGRATYAAVPGLLATSAVLVAPSIPHGRWREQIGLAIVEGLSVGLTVVTTADTGLAPWLSANGHRVIETGEVASMLSVQIADALLNPIPRAEVLASLPAERGRIAAAHWLAR